MGLDVGVCEDMTLGATVEGCALGAGVAFGISVGLYDGPGVGLYDGSGVGAKVGVIVGAGVGSPGPYVG